jgi:predicted phosphodiesterase
MPSDSPKSIGTLDDYRRAVDALIQRVGQDARATELVKEIELLLQFEHDHRVSDADRLSACLSAPQPTPGGRTAIISDLHGNHAGLCVALEDIAKQNCDRILCLGDLVEGGPENEKVIETIQEQQIPCVRGNHDENNDLGLSERCSQFLQNLPERLVEEDVLYTHISPRSIKRKIDHEVEAWNVFDESQYWLIFVGHAHMPLIFGERCAAFGEATCHPFEYNRPFALSSEDRYIVPVGSVGYGRDRIGKIRYAIFDREAKTVEHRALDGPVLALDYTFG